MGQSLLPLPVARGAPHQLPVSSQPKGQVSNQQPAFADMNGESSRAIATLPDQTLDQVLQAYRLDPRGLRKRQMKARAIWLYLGGEAHAREMSELPRCF